MGFISSDYFFLQLFLGLVPELDSAGFSAMSFNDQGAPLVKYKWTVPGIWPQTPQAAEYMAIPTSLSVITGPSQFFGD